MSRSRNIKPGFFTNELLVELPFEYRLLFVGLWTLADRDGRLEDRPTKIKMALFPADAVDVAMGLQALHDSGFVLRYEAQGRRLVQVLAWAKHQNPHFREAQSTLPAHDPSAKSEPKASGSKAIDDAIASGQPQSSPESNGGSARLIPDSGFLIPDSIEKPKATVQLVAQDDRFAEFWNLYPVKKGKAAAARAWKKIRPAQVDMILLQLERQTAADDDWIRGFCPHPATYINGERWNDAIAKPRQAATNQPGKTMGAILALEGMKSGNQLALGRDTDRTAEAPVPRIGSAAGR